ncbi:light-harvesting antenna LH1, beta subunit [Pararhodospirillum photometricum]|uniref:Light-harvesting protein B-870 beta chain n=1 Tax=Pararhodospirillum photometricum DSM 122 TaxID=1150469 RepID=H6SJF8_PARPM|nr:light-harvesting antenna LH1, beta subunit [Pararhodospirillum photometricum]CCG08123.1 Light-harvesting protein B-870 beta chain [Pararhodospirillum photometricum DSM 122]
MVDNATLNEEEAKEFHNTFSSSASGFIAVAAIAHVLAWLWRPWIPGPNGYAMDLVNQTLTFLS